MKNRKKPKFVIEIQTDKYDAAAHFYSYARRYGYKVKILDFSDEESEPKEVAHYYGIKK